MPAGSGFGYGPRRYRGGGRIILLTVATAGTIWLVVAVVAGIAALLINLGLAIKADGSWVDVAFDAIGLLTLGAGSVIGRSIQAAWKGMSRRWLLRDRRRHSTLPLMVRSSTASPAASSISMWVFAWRVPVRLPFVTKMAEGYRGRHRRCAWSRAGGLARHNDRNGYSTWPASGGVVSTRQGLRPGSSVPG